MKFEAMEFSNFALSHIIMRLNLKYTRWTSNLQTFSSISYKQKLSPIQITVKKQKPA